MNRYRTADAAMILAVALAAFFAVGISILGFPALGKQRWCAFPLPGGAG
jgi:hypothetical protein